MYERDEAAGGLIRFGVPEFKIEKRLVERRVEQLRAEGVEFDSASTSAATSRPRRSAASTTRSCSPSGRACRAICPFPGRELDGVRFAMEYLYDRARAIAGGATGGISAAGKHVVVIGGGDTGADCVAHAHRERAASVLQIELLGEPPPQRPDDVTPWPRWPMKLRTSYALHEGGDREFSLTTTALAGPRGRVEEIRWQRNTGVPPFDLVSGTDESRPAELVLLALGFVGPEPALLEAFGVERDLRGNAAGSFATSADGVFAAGDARRGQSLIVWAIREGRDCAAAVRRWLDFPFHSEATEPGVRSAA